MPKVFSCSACGGQHKRPVGAKCQFQTQESIDSSTSDVISNQNFDNTNTQIINALNAVSSILTAIEQRIERIEAQLQSTVKPGLAGANKAGLGTSTPDAMDEESDAEDDAVIPTMRFLKDSKQIQHAVDQRLQQLTQINDQGMFKSQRGGKEQVMVKNQVPWLQNYVLAGTSKSRVTYDSLSTF